MPRLATKTIDDPVPSHAEQPGRRMLHRLQHPVGRYELVEHILQDVLYIALVRHILPDEIPQPSLLTDDRLRDASILLAHLANVSQFEHLLVKTNGGRKYCGGIESFLRSSFPPLAVQGFLCALCASSLRSLRL